MAVHFSSYKSIYMSLVLTAVLINWSVCLKENFYELPTGDFSLTQMFEVLRDDESGISRGTDHHHPTAGSMVSAHLAALPTPPFVLLVEGASFGEEANLLWTLTFCSP